MPSSKHKPLVRQITDLQERHGAPIRQQWYNECAFLARFKFEEILFSIRDILVDRCGMVAQNMERR